MKLRWMMGWMLLGASLAFSEDAARVQFKPMKFGGSEEFGAASQMLINSDQTYFTKGEWMDHFGSYFLKEATVDERVDLAIGLGGVFQFPKQEHSQQQFGGSQYKLFFVGPAVAKVAYKFGSDPEHPAFTFGGGMFPYKYNPDAVNLGEYLFRTTPYPSTIMTGGLNIINDNAAHLQGFMGTWKSGGFSLDILLPTQTSMPPLYDWSLAAVAGYTSEGGLFSVGAGANMQRVVPVRPSRTSREMASNSYFSRNGKDYTGNVAYYDNAATFYNSKKTGADSAVAKTYSDQSDSVKAWTDSSGLVPGAKFYTTAGTVVMAHASLALGKLFSSDLLGENDLRLYFEAALLGVQNYPVFYDKPVERLPIMVGFNLPTFKALDILSVQMEYYKNSYINSTYSLGNSNTATPWIAQGVDPLYSQNDFMDLAKKDDFSWNILARKTFLKTFSVNAQVARDHLRTIGTNWFYGTRNEPAEVLRTSSDWYWMVQFAWNI